MSKSLPPFYFVKRGVSMAESIDSLQIEINAKASRANDAIDRLVGKIDRLTTSMNRLDGSKLASLANGVQRLGTAMQTMNNVKTADFTRLSRNLQNLNNVDVSKLSNLSVNVKRVATAFNGLSGMEKSAEQISLLANGIKQLGYSSADKAITNIPLLATAMKKFMAELSTAPKVSRNIIDMTNAVAKFARTGSSGGRAANTLVNSFNRVSKSSIGLKSNLLSAVNGISAIRRSILSAMGVAGGFYAVFQGIKESINIASDLTEVQNVVDVTFGDFKNKIEDLAKVSIPELGMSELTVKEIGSRFQAMGTAMGISQKGMADMSTELTRLAGDMASFYNVEQKAVGEDLESIFTGQTKPLRQYGLDLTEATLQEWAMSQGINANINSMSQMEKTMLRYQYVMENTGAAQGDFIRTADTWANQVRVLKENFRALASVIGSSFINALKPLVKALNNAMSYIIAFAKVVSNSLGKIFGWQYEESGGGLAADYEDAADAAGDLANGTGKAADNAKKLKQQLQGIDELNVLTSNNDTSSGGGSGSGGGATGEEDASGGKWTKTDSILKDYESQLDTLYKLGEEIGKTLTDAMKKIDWDSIYEGAKDFGTGLASFLNGLISPELFGELGTTIAGALNTALYALNSFGKTFDWKDFGESIASGINNFFSTFDFRNLADTINTWVDGIKTTLVTTIKNIKWSDVIKGAFEFLDELEFDTIAIAVGAFAFTHGGKELTASLLNGLLKDKLGIDDTEKLLGNIKAKVGVSLITAITSYKIGNWLYDNVSAIQKFSDGVSAWIFKDGEEIAIARTISVALAGLAISLPIASIAGATIAAASSGTLTTALYVWATDTLIPTLTTFFTTTLPALLTTVFPVLITIGVAVGGFMLGEKLYEKFPAVKDFSDWIVSLFGDALSGQTLRYDLPFQLGIDATVEDILDTSGLGEIITKLDDAFGNPNSPREFFVNVKGNIDEKAQQIKEWFSDKTTEVKEFISNLKGKIEETFNNAKATWDGVVAGAKDWVSNLKGNLEQSFTNVKNAWDGISAGVKELMAKAKAEGKEKIDGLKESWSKIAESVKNVGLKATAKAVGKTAIDGIKKSWDKLLKSDKVKKLQVAFQDNFTKPLKNAWNKLASVINKGIVGMNKVLPKNLEISVRVPTFAMGGFPEDGWFRASHGEMLGKFDNGQSVVANNQQITEGISAAVYRGNQQMVSYMQQEITELRTQNQLLTELLNKEVGISYSDVGKASQKYAREYTNRTGKPAYI
jgi:hypothetical protein